MAINRYRFYLGPLGFLQPLPAIPSGNDPQVAQVLPGAEQVSLAGVRTFDRSGHSKRAWQFSWDRITEDDELVMQAAFRRSANAPLRFMDPRKRNLLPSDVSSCGSSTLSSSSFTKTGAATLVWTAGGLPTVFQGLLAGRLVWTSVTNTQTLYATAEQTPIMTGSTYRISAYVKTTTTFKFSVRVFDSAGAESAQVLDATNNASTAGVWTRLSWLYTPAAGVASVYTGITATGSGNIETVGWSAQVDEALKNWSYGYGCPVVYVAPSLPSGYWKTKYHKPSLTLVEV
jgi:hypothetical protein